MFCSSAWELSLFLWGYQPCHTALLRLMFPHWMTSTSATIFSILWGHGHLRIVGQLWQWQWHWREYLGKKPNLHEGGNKCFREWDGGWKAQPGLIVFYIKERFAKTHPKRHLFEHNHDDNDDDDGGDVHLAASASALCWKSSRALGTALPAKWWWLWWQLKSADFPIECW